MNKILSSGLVIGAMVSLVGCGGGSDSVIGSAVDTVTDTVATGTSYYIDSAVSGVNYTCGSQEGITGTDGSFTFEVGSSCTFTLGDIALRDVDTGLLVDGGNLVETDVKVAVVLQSLDSDGDASNGITISAEIVAALVAAGITSLPTTDDALAEFAEVVEANGGTVVTEAEAQAHLDETTISLLLTGKTFYFVGQDVNDATDIWSGEATFNADLTEMTITENGETGSESISIDGDRLVFSDNTDGSYTVIGEIQSDYIELIDYYSDGTIEANSRLYFDEAKADVYLASLSGYIIITEAMLIGKTFYDYDYDDNGDYGFGKMTMTATEFTRSEIWYDANGDVIIDGSEGTDGISTFTLPYELVDGKIRVDVAVFEEGYFWFGLLSETADTWNMKKAQDIDKDGLTEDSSEGTSTWYLSKPAEFPASL